MEHKKLKPCPFCGGVAELYKCKIYLDDAIRVICRSCGVATQKVLVDHLQYSGGKEIYITGEKAVQEVTDVWNRRSSNE